MTSSPLVLRGLRGATTCTENSTEAIEAERRSKIAERARAEAERGMNEFLASFRTKSVQ